MGRIVWIVRNKPKSQTGDMDDFEDIWEGKDYEFYQKIQVLEKKPFELVEFIKVIEDCRSKLTKVKKIDELKICFLLLYCINVECECKIYFFLVFMDDNGRQCKTIGALTTNS